MTTRKLTPLLCILTALLFAGAAHAGGYSMDAGGAVADTGSSASASTSNRDCVSGTPAVTDGSGDSGVHDGTRSSSSPGAKVAVVDDGGSASAEAAPGGGSSPPDAISVPIKTRSNRWQSLVPGAIK